MNPILAISESDLDAAVLANVARVKAERDDLTSIGETASKLYPAPEFTPQDVEGWREKDEQWKANFYGSIRQIAYADCVSCHVARAFIRLTKAGKIREHITGHGFSLYSLR